jgi:hypothetical protein
MIEGWQDFGDVGATGGGSGTILGEGYDQLDIPQRITKDKQIWLVNVGKSDC